MGSTTTKLHPAGRSKTATNPRFAEHQGLGERNIRVYSIADGLLLINNTVAHNSAPESGGIYCPFGTAATIWNSIFWRNTPGQIDGEATVRYSDIEGGWVGAGNINVDPAFVDPSSNDFHLGGNSPCINVGDSSREGIPEEDFEGDPRILQGIVDMGADESASGHVVDEVTPNEGLFHREQFVLVRGGPFEQTGFIEVFFGSTQSQIVTWLSAEELVCLVPVGVEDTIVDVTVTQGEDTATLEDAYAYLGTSIEGIDIIRGNIIGGTTVRLDAQLTTDVDDTTVLVNGSPAIVTEVTADSVEILTPGEPDVPSGPVDIEIICSNGSDTLPGAFTYTPLISVGVTGDTEAGSIDLSWVVDPTADPSQLIALWLGFPGRPPLGAPVPGFAGLLWEIPWFHLLVDFPAHYNPISIPFGPVPPEVAGVVLAIQATFAGEGDILGSFSNRAEFVIPAPG